MEKPKEIQSSAEIVISKITDKESVITVTLNNPHERGNDSEPRMMVGPPPLAISLNIYNTKNVL